MGHATLTATSPATAFTALNTWITGNGAGQLGWTTVDTVSQDADVVYSINGGGTRATVYIRMTRNLAHPEKATQPHLAYDNITFRLYRSWDAGAHTGKGETGLVANNSFLFPIRYSPPTLQNLYQFNVVKKRMYAHPELNRLGNSNRWLSAYMKSNVVFDGRGFLQYIDGAGINMLDPATKDCSVWFTTAISSANSPFIHTVDAASGKGYLWFFKTSSQSAGNFFYRMDMLSGDRTAMADPPWGTTFTTGSNGSGCAWAWNGADKIYMSTPKAYGTAMLPEFQVYTISTNTWASLPNPFPNNITITSGTIDSSTQGFNQMVYVPTTVSGKANDELYFVPGDGTVYWYRLTLDGNPTWAKSDGAGFANLPLASYYRGVPRIWLDPNTGVNGKIFYATSSGNGVYRPGNLYAYDVAANTWSSQITEFNPTVHIWYQEAYSYLYQQCNPVIDCGYLALPTSNAEITLECVGDANHLKAVASWTAAGDLKATQRFVYAGFYSSSVGTDTFTTTAEINPGANVQISVGTDVTGKLTAGRIIELYDPAATVHPERRNQTLTTGGGETCVVVSIDDQTHVTLDKVLGTYPVGTKVGEDVAGAIVANDSMFAVRLQGDNGFCSDGDADWYFVVPSRSPDRTQSAVGRRGIAVLGALELVQSINGKPTQGFIGTLSGVYIANPLCVAGDIDTVAGNSYYVFNPLIRDKNEFDPRLLEMGPVN